MRFFSNDARETPDDEARADERPERVKSDPVAVPTQRPSSPWAATPGTANLGAANSGLNGPGLGGSSGQPVPGPGPVAGKRPAFHESDAQPTPFGSAAGGEGGAVAAMAGSAPAADRHTDSDHTAPAYPGDRSGHDQADDNLVLDDWSLGEDDNRADGRGALDGPTALDNPIAGQAARGGAIALGGRTTAEDDDESTPDPASADRHPGDQPPAAEPSTAGLAGSPTADAPAAVPSDDAPSDADQVADHPDDDDATEQPGDVAGSTPSPATTRETKSFDDDSAVGGHDDGAVDGHPDSAVPADREDTSDLKDANVPDAEASTGADPRAHDGAADSGSSADAAAPAGGLLPGTVPQPKLGPLFADADSHSFKDRWRDVQLLFVDDPKAAAADAATLVDEAVDALAASLRAQREQLAGATTDAPGGDTEQLRVRLRSYRDFLDRLLGL